MITARPAELALRSLAADWTRERWEQLPVDGNRYEVIDGVLYVSTSPSLFHQWVIRQLVRALLRQIDDVGLGTTWFAPVGVFMPGCDPVQPDVLVVTADQAHILRDDKHIQGVPALIVEVLSPGNADSDTRIKRAAYARAGVPEYWMFRPASRDALQCWRPDPALGDFAESKLITQDEELLAATLPLRLRLAELFEGAPNTLL